MSEPVSSQRSPRKRYPRHEVVFEVREAALETSDALARKMHGWLDELCELREDLRRERADDRARARVLRAAGGTHRYITKSDQYRRISALARTRRSLRGIHSQMLQDVADRIELGTRRWLMGKGGPVRFVPRKRYRSFTFTQYGFAVKIRSGRLHMSGLGEARLLGLRRLPGRVKSVRLVFKQGRWFAQFTCEVQVKHCERARRHASAAVRALPDTGLDTGLARAATLADGTAFPPAKPLKKALPRLRQAQRKMSRQFRAREAEFAAYCSDFRAAGHVGPLPARNHLPYSNRLRNQIRAVARLHTKVENIRRDQHRKVARQIEANYRLVAVEEHGVRFMQRNRRTARSVADVAPGAFKRALRRALGEHRYVPVGTSRPGIGGNSQTCLCGASVPKALEERWHTCPDCGLSENRDTVSANIAMTIAFGYSTLEANGPEQTFEEAPPPPGPGHGLVRRGASEGSAAMLPTACGASRTTEPALKRPSSGRQRPVCETAGAQATARVNNLLFMSPSGRLNS